MQSGSTPQVQDRFKGIDTPSKDDLSFQIQQLVEQGVISPEDAKTALAGRSEMDNVTTDPRLKAAQEGALSQLQDIGSSGGMTLNDKANLNQIAVDEATKAKGQRDAIIQSAAAKGMGGSGLDLMAQLQNEQNAASNKSTRDLNVAGMAQQRALDALMQGGTLAGNIQNQQFNQGAAKATANDAISKFNAQNENAVNMANTQAHNAAQANNLANKQNIANTNANIQTQQNAQKSGVAQQMFNNKIAKAGGQQSSSNLNAQIQGQNSQNQANANNQTIGTGLTVAAMMSDERNKESVKEFNPSDFLDSITGHKFKYKEPKKFGEGEHVGVMAQDLEKTAAGSQLVHDTPEGKVVDYGKAGPHILASLANLNKRMKKIGG
jgi:hypothetical protein